MKPQQIGNSDFLIIIGVPPLRVHSLCESNTHVCEHCLGALGLGKFQLTGAGGGVRGECALVRTWGVHAQCASHKTALA